MATVTYMICDECGERLPEGREMKGVTKQHGQVIAELCPLCCQRLTVAEAIKHMEERAAKQVRPAFHRND